MAEPHFGHLIVATDMPKTKLPLSGEARGGRVSISYDSAERGRGGFGASGSDKRTQLVVGLAFQAGTARRAGPEGVALG